MSLVKVLEWLEVFGDVAINKKMRIKYDHTATDVSTCDSILLRTSFYIIIPTPARCGAWARAGRESTDPLRSIDSMMMSAVARVHCGGTNPMSDLAFASQLSVCLLTLRIETNDCWQSISGVSTLLL